ncbi:MAG: hypothetical protein ACRCWL_06110, partial [Aeromonas sp.]
PTGGAKYQHAYLQHATRACFSLSLAGSDPRRLHLLFLAFLVFLALGSRQPERLCRRAIFVE